MAGRKKAGTGLRDAERTRQALVDATRWLLTRHGYDQLGTRDIAERAGVDAALVHRYFGTKKKLVAKALDKALAIAPYIGERAAETLPAHLAQVMAEQRKDRERFDVTAVLLRSAASTEMQKMLARAIEDDYAAPMAERLGTDDGHLRALMMLAVLAGFDMMRVIFGSDALSSPEARRMLERVLRACSSDGEG